MVPSRAGLHIRSHRSGGRTSPRSRPGVAAPASPPQLLIGPRTPGQAAGGTPGPGTQERNRRAPAGWSPAASRQRIVRALAPAERASRGRRRQSQRRTATVARTDRHHCRGGIAAGSEIGEANAGPGLLPPRGITPRPDARSLPPWTALEGACGERRKRGVLATRAVQACPGLAAAITAGAATDATRAADLSEPSARAAAGSVRGASWQPPRRS